MCSEARILLPLWLAAAVAAQQEAGAARVTVDEAVTLAFPDCKIERKAQVLSKEELARVRTLSGAAADRSLHYAYVATRAGKEVGVAYVDAHLVRTHAQRLLIAVDAACLVSRIEVLGFDEPAEYLPRAAFYQQFVGKALDDELRVKRGVRAVTGATLTTQATVDAVRRTLAVHQVLAEQATAAAKKKAEPTPPEKK